MGFLKVLVPGRESQDIDVLINRQTNGKTGEVLVLGDEIVLVSVDLPGAPEKQVDLEPTTAQSPAVVEISV